jgi:hypothetical protein
MSKPISPPAVAGDDDLDLPAYVSNGVIGLRVRCQPLQPGMVVPRRGDAVVSHDDYRKTEEKGATPDPLMGVWPFGFCLSPEQERATLSFYLDLADDYIGSPMLSALYGAWAARLGDRSLSLRLLDEGYAKFETGRFAQILEYRPDRFPEQPRAGPFFANMGGFLSSLILGFPRLEPGSQPPQAWACAPTVLPAGWEAIEVDRVFIHGRPMKLVARHGATATLTELEA